MSSSTAPSDGQKVSVLFVCLGNICRSPMADGVFQHLTNHPSHPLISQIDSCGTGAYHANSPPDPRTISVLKAHGLTSYTHRARRVICPSDFQNFDYILAMDESNYEDLKDLAKRAVRKGQLEEEAVGRVRLYGEFGGKSKREEIVDPWYDGGKEGFEVAYEQVERMGKGLLKEIEKKAGEKSEL